MNTEEGDTTDEVTVSSERPPTAHVPPGLVTDDPPEPIPAGSNFTDGDVFVWTPETPDQD